MLVNCICSQSFEVRGGPPWRCRCGTLNGIGSVSVNARLSQALRIATRALSFYAKRSNWAKDDWAVRAVIVPPDYEDAGRKARGALERIQVLEPTAAKKLRCPCGAEFTSAAYQAKYCSPKCREREVKKRYRARKNPPKERAYA